MLTRAKRFVGGKDGGEKASRTADDVLGGCMTRRNLFRASALLGFAALTLPARQALAWSSWTNMTSPILKGMGMGDCVHEDLVQIAYARAVRKLANQATPDSLLNPWAGTIQDDARYASIAGDIVDVGEGKVFADADDLATRLYRENLAYLRIGSFWNDAAANTLADFSYSCYYADSVPKFSGVDHYEGAWDVGQHLWETNEENKTKWIKGLDALVQFTMNDRSGFIHSMLTSTASHSAHLKQSEVKQCMLEFLGVAYEYARTGEVRATSDVTQEQAEKIFKGFIDVYGQLDENAHDMSLSLKVGSSEASLRLPHRRLRLRALGMVCHTLEDSWCPAHTCRTYHDGGSIPKNSILAFSNYKLQNGNKQPMFGYHIPFDRYATSDSENATNWREALTRGDSDYTGTETLANALDPGMGCLDGADTFFNTLGMNESIACITRLFEYVCQGTAWDDGVRQWVDAEVLLTYFDESGQSYTCDAGRRSLHTPTYVIAPIQAMKRAYRKAGLQENYDNVLAVAKDYDAWQRGAHSFYSGKYNTSQSKYIMPGHEGDSIWDDGEGERRLMQLVDRLHEGYSGLDDSKRNDLLSKVGPNCCHDMVRALSMVGGMLQDFNIDLRGSLRPSDEATMARLSELRSFFASGTKGQDSKLSSQSSPEGGLIASADSFADEYEEDFITSNMVVDDLVRFEDGSFYIAVRDVDSLETSVMVVPSDTPGIEMLVENIANLTITYTLEAEFGDDLDYRYVVTDIDFADMENGAYLITGTVASVSEDAKSIVLNLNGTGDLELAVQDETYDVPQVGTYLCARIIGGSSGYVLVSYDELDTPGELMVVTYPVAKVCGSCVWLLTNGDEAHAEDGHRKYLVIDYGTADVYEVPQEGHELTVCYHDEAYGDVTDMDEFGPASDGFGQESTEISEQAEDELSDSAVPGYLELGDEYGNLSYGNEVFHVANLIGDPFKDPNDLPKNTDEGEPSQPEVTPGEGDSKPGDRAGSNGADTSDNGTQTNNQTNSSGSTQRPSPIASTGSTQKSSSSLPKTGDSLAGLNGVLLAMAAAGTALVAHSGKEGYRDRGED